MELVIKYLNHVSVFLNGKMIEPAEKLEKQVSFKIPNVVYPTTLEIVHYDDQRELQAYSKPTSLRAIRNCFNRGFEHRYCCLHMVFSGRLPKRLNFEVRERYAKSGFLSYSSSSFYLLNGQVPSGVEIQQTYYSSENEKRWALIIPVIKWLIILVLLGWFDISWASEILYHTESAEVYTNLLSSVHLFGTIPILTLSVFAIFILDIRGIAMQRKLQKKF